MNAEIISIETAKELSRLKKENGIMLDIISKYDKKVILMQNQLSELYKFVEFDLKIENSCKDYILKILKKCLGKEKEYEK